jgi:hypothetical protein
MARGSECCTILCLLAAIVTVTVDGADTRRRKIPVDDPGDVKALTALALSTNHAKWNQSDNWMTNGTSVCTWFGIKCKKGRVTSIDMTDNGMQGELPVELKYLTELVRFHLKGSRPANYHGCRSMNFKNSSLSPLYNLPKVTIVDAEYACFGGTLEGVHGMKALESFQVHGNYISGTIPAAIGELTNIVTLKLGRNPITGTLPAITTLKKVVQFNCNFCALSGKFPDIFGQLPSLQISYWDGNGFSGSLPPSLGLAKKLTRLSFNINNFTGPIPPKICDIPAGQKGGDCRIGADTELGPYQAFYPWLLPVKGNYYDCSAGVPSCALSGNSCNTTDMYPSKAQNFSIVRCSDPGAVTIV